MADILADLQQKRHPAATWTSNNPTLKAGEAGWESDTGKKKTGDGSTAWTSLPYDIAAYNASDLETTPSGNLEATDVQDALDELQTDVDTRASGLTTDAGLAWAVEAEAVEYTSVTWTDGVATSATVKWPDGSAGTFTADTVDSDLGAVDAYTVTHADSGRQVVQAAVTRDADGNVTVKPALTVEDTP